MILTLAVLGVTITCSICYDRADDSSIHRGTYDILESIFFLMGTVALYRIVQDLLDWFEVDLEFTKLYLLR